MNTEISSLLFFFLFLHSRPILSKDRIIYKCDPAASCATSDHGSKVPDPNDCHKYYQCIEDSEGNTVPTDVSFECPDGQYFDYEDTLECQEETEEACHEPCLNFQCEYECDHVPYFPYFIADPNDCSKYYVCASGTEVIAEVCPDKTPFFDGSQCIDSDYYCCDACIPHCDQIDTETMDPYDCRKFYFCDDFGVPGESNHFSCPSGEYFEPDLGTCQDEGLEGCQSFCHEITQITTTTMDATSEYISMSTFQPRTFRSSTKVSQASSLESSESKATHLWTKETASTSETTLLSESSVKLYSASMSTKMTTDADSNPVKNNLKA